MGLLDKLLGNKNTDNNVSKVQQGYPKKGHINATSVNITNSNRYDIQNNFIAIEIHIVSFLTHVFNYNSTNFRLWALIYFFTFLISIYSV